MAHRKPNGSLPWCRIASVAGIVAAGIGAAVYFWNQSKVVNDHDKPFKKPKGPSKAIIITHSVASQKDIDWDQLLQEDVVLLVTPGVLFLEVTTNDRPLAHRYKIIHCDTMIGLWSCVKHLQKEQLLYVEVEIASEIPNDLTRYVKKLINFKNSQQLKDSCV